MARRKDKASAPSSRVVTRAGSNLAGSIPRTNFAHLQEHDELLLRLGLLAERYLPGDPNTSLLKLRKLAELLAQLVAAKVGLYLDRQEGQHELLSRLQDHGILPREVAHLFGEVRRAGNAANHAIAGARTTALTILKISWQLGLWFHRTFKDPAFHGGPFLIPHGPADTPDEIRKLTKEEQDAAHGVEARLAEKQSVNLTAPKTTLSRYLAAAGTVAEHVELDEAETRKLIDQQLRQAGWTADTQTLTYSRGTRPQKGESLAIAEWPTTNGPADYVLFVGLVVDGWLEDYLKEFAEFITSRSNTIPALFTVLTRPRELTRKQLRELAMELDRAGFSEASLGAAWRDMTNRDIAARIVGFIRQAAIGDALIPYEQRVDRALETLFAKKNFTAPQRQWLQKIAAQTKANLIVDRAALDDSDQIFKREGGGFARLDRLFGGELLQLLDTFNDALWRPAA